MGRTVHFGHVGQVAIDLAAYGALVLIAELDADTDHRVALRTRGGRSDDFPDDGNRFGLGHKPQQQEDLVAEAIAPVCKYEYTAVLEKRHEGRVERGLVLDHTIEDTLLLVVYFRVHGGCSPGFGGVGR